MSIHWHVTVEKDVQVADTVSWCDWDRDWCSDSHANNDALSKHLNCSSVSDECHSWAGSVPWGTAWRAECPRADGSSQRSGTAVLFIQLHARENSIIRRHLQHQWDYELIKTRPKLWSEERRFTESYIGILSICHAAILYWNSLTYHHILQHIILVFPVLNVFAKFRQCHGLLGFWIQMGYILQHTILVFPVLNVFAKFRQCHGLLRFWIQMGYINLAIFGQYLARCRKRYKIGPCLLWKGNRNIQCSIEPWLSDLRMLFLYRCYFVCAADVGIS